MNLYSLIHECDRDPKPIYLKTKAKDDIFKRRIDKWSSYAYMLDYNAFITTENMALILLSYGDTYLVPSSKIDNLLKEDEYISRYIDNVNLFYYSESPSDIHIINKNDNTRLLMIDKMLADFYIL